MSENVVTSVYAKVGFLWDSLKLKELVNIIGNLNVSTIGAAIGLGKLGEVVDNVLKDTQQTAISLQGLVAETGVEEKFAYQWRVIAKEFGSTADEADNVINSISKVRMAILNGDVASARPFNMMQIDWAHNTIPEIMKKVGEWENDPAKLQQWANNFGLQGKNKDEILAQFKNSVLSPLSISGNMQFALDQYATKGVGNIQAPDKQTFENSKESLKAWVNATNDLSVGMSDSLAGLTKTSATLLENINKAKVIPAVFDGLKWMVDGYNKRWQNAYDNAIAEGEIANARKVASEMTAKISTVNNLVDPNIISDSNSQSVASITNNVNVTVTAHDVQTAVDKFHDEMKFIYSNANVNGVYKS